MPAACNAIERASGEQHAYLLTTFGVIGRNTNTMMQLKAESLRELSREELIAIILQLFERLARLGAELAGRKPSPTSRNSSRPHRGIK